MTAECEILVRGVVQGVGFRYFVLQRARRLNLFGFVCNLEMGDVKIIAEGERSLLEELIRYVKVGPPNAHVDYVDVLWNTWTGKFYKFEIR